MNEANGSDIAKSVSLNVHQLSETAAVRAPIHVVYGGAHLYRAETAAKLGERALESVGTYAPNFIEFAHAMNLPETGSLPRVEKAVASLESQIRRSPAKAKDQDFGAWFAWTVYERTMEKLTREPVEDFRIDFEDGYGFRPDDEEDAHAVSAARELAASAFTADAATPFCGFRIKSFAPAMFERAARTLDIFLSELFRTTNGRLPANLAVTLPKVTNRKQVKRLSKLLARHEKQAGIANGSIGVEIMIETPEAILDAKGRVPLRGFVNAAGDRNVSVHFGAYDYTAALSIAAPFQDIRHPACDHARNVMQAALAPTGVRLSDSVTTQMPVPVHRGSGLTETQKTENRRAVHAGWRRHFANVTHSLASGFYQSWDLHPNQLPARYAAVYAFFLFNYAAQAVRLRTFIERAAQATLSGTTFDDAASAEGILNFFRRALDCGALTDGEVVEATGLSPAQIRTLDFSDLAG